MSVLAVHMLVCEKQDEAEGQAALPLTAWFVQPGAGRGATTQANVSERESSAANGLLHLLG